MDLDNLTIGEARKLAAMFGGQSQCATPHPFVGRFVIIRSRNAGVHSGVLKSVDGASATLTNARRLWRWRGANTLNEVALHGVSTDWTRNSESVAEISIVDICEIIPCSDKARASLEVSQWAK